MKKLLLLLILAIFPAITLAGPKIEFSNNGKLDWGDVKLNQNPLKGTVTVKNVGDEELVIQNVKPSCGCTTAPIQKDRLQPGESTTIDVQLKISHGGPVNKSIRIASNDPNKPNSVVSLHANVLEMLKVTPSSTLRFRNLEVGKESKSKVSIENKDKVPIKLSDIKLEVKIANEEIEASNMIVTFFDDDGNKLGNDVSIKPGRKVDLIATVTPQASGYFRAKITMNTDHPDHKELKISGYGNVKKSPVFNSSQGN